MQQEYVNPGIYPDYAAKRKMSTSNKTCSCMVYMVLDNLVNSIYSDSEWATGHTEWF